MGVTEIPAWRRPSIIKERVRDTYGRKIGVILRNPETGQPQGYLFEVNIKEPKSGSNNPKDVA